MSWTCKEPSVHLKLRIESKPKNQNEPTVQTIQRHWELYQQTLAEALLPFDDARAAAADALLRLNKKLKEQTQ